MGSGFLIFSRDCCLDSLLFSFVIENQLKEGRTWGVVCDGRRNGANSKISKQPGKSQHSLLLLQHEQIDTCLLLLLLTLRTVYVVQYLLTKSRMNGDALLALSSVHPMSCRLDDIGCTKETLEIETLKSVGRI